MKKKLFLLSVIMLPPTLPHQLHRTSSLQKKNITLLAKPITVIDLTWRQSTAWSDFEKDFYAVLFRYVSNIFKNLSSILKKIYKKFEFM